MIARKIYIEIYWNEHDTQITQSLKKTAVFVSSLFRYYLPKIETKSTKKINIEQLRFETSYENIYPLDVMNADIISVSTLFDFQEFDKLEQQEQKETLLRTVHDQVALVFQRLQLDITVLKETYDRVIENNFAVHIKICGPEKFNRNRTMKAVAILEYFVGYNLLSVLFFDKTGRLIQNVEIFKIRPNCFMYIIKFAKWIDNEVFQISDPSKRINFHVNLNGTITTQYDAGEKENRLKEMVEMCTIGDDDNLSLL